MPATSAAHNRLLFLLRPFTVLMKQTSQSVRAVKQSIFLDVYEFYSLNVLILDEKCYLRYLVCPRKSNRKGRLRAVYLILLTSRDFRSVPFFIKILLTFLTKQVTLIRRSMVQSLIPHLVFPVLWYASADCLALLGSVVVYQQQ